MLNSIKITDITKTKKGFNALFADEEFLFSVDDVVLYRNNIQIGSCFTRQELACISKQSQDAKAVDKMEELDLIDDSVFAQMKAEYLLNVKKQSLSAVKLKLASLGIDKDIIDSVLLNFELDNQIDEISSLLQSKYRSKLSSPEKVVASLLRKGFKYGEIKQAFNNLNINLQEY